VKVGVDLELFHHLGDGPEAKTVDELAVRTGAEAELLSKFDFYFMVVKLG
jgi:hypothetical protein